MAITESELAELGFVPVDSPILHRPASRAAIPVDVAQVEQAWDRLNRIGVEIRRRHPTDKGLGIAAPQVGIDMNLSWFLPKGGAKAIMLLNPRIVQRSEATDVQFEGCL